MSINVTKYLYGVTAQAANDGFPIASMASGPRGAGPTTIVIMATADHILPLDCESCSILLYPGTRLAVGASNGSVGVISTLASTGNDKVYDVVSGSQATFVDGFWAGELRALVSAVNLVDVTVDFSISWSAFSASDFVPGLVSSPTNVNAGEPSWNSETGEGSVNITFQYTNPTAENPAGFMILRELDGITEEAGSVPWTDGVVDYNFTDFVFVAGDYSYTVMAYEYVDFTSSPESDPVIVSFSGVTPDISYVGTLLADFALASEFVFIGDPSGIYTIVPNKRHDTLYERTDVDSIDVKIPDPFVKTSFVP